MEGEGLRLRRGSGRTRSLPITPDPAARAEIEHPAGLGEDSGPHPVVRAVVGLLLGVAAGALATLLTPRPSRRPPVPAGPPPVPPT